MNFLSFLLSIDLPEVQLLGAALLSKALQPQMNLRNNQLHLLVTQGKGLASTAVTHLALPSILLCLISAFLSPRLLLGLHLSDTIVSTFIFASGSSS